MQQDLQMKTNEIQREGRKKDRLERDLRQAKADLEAKVNEMKNLQQSLENSKGNVDKLNGDLKEQKVVWVSWLIFVLQGSTHPWKSLKVLEFFLFQIQGLESTQQWWAVINYFLVNYEIKLLWSS